MNIDRVWLAICLCVLIGAQAVQAQDFSLYQVDVVGENYLVNMNGNTRKLGFITSKYVEAPSLEEAERLAIRLVKLHLRGKVLNPEADPPQLSIAESIRLENLSGGPQEAALGLVWYPMPS
jgi:hypothetical protein